MASFTLAGCGLLLDPDLRAVDSGRARDATLPDGRVDTGYDAVTDSACGDGGCPACPAIERRLTMTANDEGGAKITAANGGFIVAWDGEIDGDGGTVLRGINVDGTTRWQRLVPDPAADPALASDDSTVALAVAGEGVVRVLPLDPMTGDSVDEHTTSYLGGDIEEPDIVISDGRWVMTWVEMLSGPNPHVVFGTLDSTGPGFTTPVSTGMYLPDVPNVAQVGDVYMVVWDENSASPPVHQAIFREGESVMPRVLGVDSDDGFVRANGTAFATVWEERDGPNRPVIQLFDGEGGSRGSVDLSPAGTYFDEPDAAWSGGSWGVVYEEGTDSETDAVIQLVVVSPDATTVLGRAQVSHGTAYAQEAAVAWSGTGWGVVWEDWRDENAEIYYAHVCP
jgi:hypothetical protein